METKLKTKTFWITNGVNSDENYRVIVKHNEKIQCSHCYNIRNGFVKLGAKNPTGLITYSICKNCLYNPSNGLVNNLFIAISKNKSLTRFNDILEECENKIAYLEVLEIGN